jgi:hypothetical protein
MAQKPKLELTWIRKENQPKLEPLIEKSSWLSFSEGNR